MTQTPEWIDDGEYVDLDMNDPKVREQYYQFMSRRGEVGMNEDLVTRLRKRAEIRRQIPTRKSVQENKPDRIADLLEEAADAIENYQKLVHFMGQRKETDPL